MTTCEKHQEFENKINEIHKNVEKILDGLFGKRNFEEFDKEKPVGMIAEHKQMLNDIKEIKFNNEKKKEVYKKTFLGVLQYVVNLQFVKTSLITGGIIALFKFFGV